MRGCFFIPFLMLAALTVVAEASIDAPGKVFYKMPSGEMVTRDVTLEVPSMGQGKVVLKGSNFSLTADRFFTVHHNGRAIFYVVFSGFPTSKEGEIAVYRGTYTRGSNLAIYYGDVFVGQDNQDDDAMVNALSDGNDDFKYIAGFYFKAEVPH